MMVTRPVKVVQVCDWCISYDLSETIMVLMSAEGLYKKPILQGISVGTSLPPPMAEVKMAKQRARFGTAEQSARSRMACSVGSGVRCLT